MWKRLYWKAKRQLNEGRERGGNTTIVTVEGSRTQRKRKRKGDLKEGGQGDSIKKKERIVQIKDRGTKNGKT